MVEAHRATPAHILVFEPRVEGHHLVYLKAITEELLGAGYRLTLATDAEPQAAKAVRAELGNLMDRVAPATAYDRPEQRRHKLVRIAQLAEQTHADLVLLPNVDEIGSNLTRRAGLGLMPPAALRGRIGGIYFRPRFLGPLKLSPNQWLKALGFKRLLAGGWFSHLLLPDPYLQAALKARMPQAPASFLPDFFPVDFAADRDEARRRWTLPADKRVLLFYGAGYRRKGLDLAVEAMRSLAASVPAFLLCAGRHSADAQTAEGLAQLSEQGRARVIERYITDEEEKQLFAAADAVLLPYRKHFGSSGVLVHAIGAGLPVIVSDEEFMGRLVREHGLGIPFAPGDTQALAKAIVRLATAAPQEMARWQAAAKTIAPTWSRQAFREALLGAVAQSLRRLRGETAGGAP
jgi:glycosyltransferase involved in cell wall biosynthesis